METDKLDHTIYLFLAFVCGVLFEGIFLNFPVIEKTFYDVKITDVFGILVMLFLGTFVLYKVTVKTTHQAKRDDVLIETASLLQKIILETHPKIKENIHDPNNGSSKDILVLLKTISTYISLTGNVFKQNKHENQKLSEIIEEIKVEYFRLKSLITGEDFGRPGAKQSEKVFSRIEQSHQNILVLIFKLKSEIFC